MQGQAEQLSKSKKKLLATTYKPFSRSLYPVRPQISQQEMGSKLLWKEMGTDGLSDNMNIQISKRCSYS